MYDLHNKTLLHNLQSKALLKEKPQDLGVFSLRGIGVVFDNQFDKVAFENCVSSSQQSGTQKSETKSKTPIDIVSAVELHPKRAGELAGLVSRVRNIVDVVLVSAIDVEVARKAAELSSVDVISHAFVDQPTAREAAVNNVALEINLRDILGVYGMRRANLISKLQFNFELAQKYNTPLVVTSGAHSLYEMRTPQQIMMFMEAIGLGHAEAKKALFETPKKIVFENRKKNSGVNAKASS